MSKKLDNFIERANQKSKITKIHIEAVKTLGVEFEKLYKLQ